MSERVAFSDRPTWRPFWPCSEACLPTGAARFGGFRPFRWGEIGAFGDDARKSSNHAGFRVSES